MKISNWRTWLAERSAEILGTQPHGQGAASIDDLSDLRRCLPELVAFGLLSNLLALALPLALLQVYDRIIPNQAQSTLILLLAGVLIAAAVEGLLRVLRHAMIGWLGARFEHRTLISALRHLLGMPLRDFMREEPDAHVERLRSVTRARDFYTGQALITLLDLPFVVLYMILIAMIGGWLVVVPAALLAAFLLVVVRAGRWMRSRVDDRIQLDKRRYGFLAETLRGIHSVKMMGMEPLMHRRYERLQEAAVGDGAELARGSAMAASLGNLFTQLMLICVVGAGALIVLQGDMTAGGLAACLMFAIRALQPLRAFLGLWIRFQDIVAARRQLFALFATPSDAGKARPALPPITRSIAIDNVSLRDLRAETALFDQLSLTIEAGQCIAICGDSGSGKSALMQLLAGLAHPDQGRILFDDRPLADFDPSSLPDRIAYLPQQAVLVAGTILDNITMFEPSRVDAAMAAARAIGMDAIVAGLKQGYDTRVGETAAQELPAGVRQRIAIARALARDPQVILFDEANLALDGSGDSLLRAYLEAQKGKRIVVLVTHRPSLLSLADAVYHIEGGKLLPGSGQGKDIRAEAAPAPILPRPELPAWDVVDAIDLVPELGPFAICLPPLLAALQWRGNAREVAESIPHLARSLSLSDLRGVMANLGYTNRFVTASLAELDGRLLPCLFVTDQGKPMVLIRQRPDAPERMQAFDPALAEIVEIDADDTAGEAHFFLPAEEVEPSVAADGWTWRTLGRFRRLIALAFAVTVLNTVLNLVSPLFVMGVYNMVLPSAALDLLIYLIIGALLAAGLDWTLRSLKSRILAYAAGRGEYILGNSIFQKIIGLPAAATDRASVGEQISRIKDLESVREFFLGPLALLVFDLPATLIYVAVLGVMNPWAVLIVVIACVLYGILGFFASGAQKRAVRDVTANSTRRWEFLNEAMSTMRPLRATGAERRWLQRFRELSGKVALNEYRSSTVNERVGATAAFLGTATGVCAMGVSVLGAMYGFLSPGAVMATMMIVWRLVGPLQNGFMAAASIFRIAHSVRQIDSLMRLSGEREATTRPAVRATPRGEVSFSRVSFRYVSDGDPALLGITLAIPAGKVAAIAGANGSGKSTMLKLLMRAFDPQAGVIRIDDVDLRQIAPVDLRSYISYMPQNCELFYGSVAQNLRLVHPTATDAELEWALDMAGLADEVAGLPDGLASRLSDQRGADYAHGFRQRLSLARTMLKPAPLVLFDEPGNGLDAEGDRALVRCIEWLRGRSTVFLVSHRPSHLRLGDAVIYLEKGVVRAIGPFSEVEKTVMAGLK